MDIALFALLVFGGLAIAALIGELADGLLSRLQRPGRPWKGDL